MNLLEASKLALDTLENLHGGCTDSDDGTYEAITVHCPEVIEALHQAIEQVEKQECAPACPGKNCGSTNPKLHSAECFEEYEETIGMNVLKKLTVNEIIFIENITNSRSYIDHARAIEAKLKENNT